MRAAGPLRPPPAPSDPRAGPGHSRPRLAVVGGPTGAGNSKARPRRPETSHREATALALGVCLRWTFGLPPPPTPAVAGAELTFGLLVSGDNVTVVFTSSSSRGRGSQGDRQGVIMRAVPGWVGGWHCPHPGRGGPSSGAGPGTLCPPPPKKLSSGRRSHPLGAGFPRAPVQHHFFLEGSVWQTLLISHPLHTLRL